MRAGWNDGATEDFVFTEVDRHLSAGLQATGTSWGRAADRLGVAVVVHGLSAAHSAYLAAGGKGFLLGDGRLNYGGEEILEAYYRFQVGPPSGWAPDRRSSRTPATTATAGPPRSSRYG